MSGKVTHNKKNKQRISDPMKKRHVRFTDGQWLAIKEFAKSLKLPAGVMLRQLVLDGSVVFGPTIHTKELDLLEAIYLESVRQGTNFNQLVTKVNEGALLDGDKLLSPLAQLQEQAAKQTQLLSEIRTTLLAQPVRKKRINFSAKKDSPLLEQKTPPVLEDQADEQATGTSL